MLHDISADHKIGCTNIYYTLRLLMSYRQLLEGGYKYEDIVSLAWLSSYRFDMVAAGGVVTIGGAAHRTN